MKLELAPASDGPLTPSLSPSEEERVAFRPGEGNAWAQLTMWWGHVAHHHDNAGPISCAA